MANAFQYEDVISIRNLGAPQRDDAEPFKSLHLQGHMEILLYALLAAVIITDFSLECLEACIGFVISPAVALEVAPDISLTGVI